MKATTLTSKLGKQGKKVISIPSAKVDTKFAGFADLLLIQAPSDPFPSVLLNCSDSIGLIILIEDSKGKLGVVQVSQRRYSMLSETNPTGLFTELVAGRTDDKKPTLLDYAKSEAYAESGVMVNDSDVVLLNGGQSVALSAGIMNERQWYVLVRVKSDQVQIVPEGHIFGEQSEDEKIVRKIAPVMDFLRTPTEDVKLLVAKGYVMNLLIKEELAKMLAGKPNFLHRLLKITL